MRLLLIALLPWLGAALAAALPRRARRTALVLAAAVALAVTALALALAPALFDGQVLRESWSWVPALGLNLTLRADGLAWLFATGIGAIGALVVLYAAWYLADDEPVPRLCALLLAFMGAMLGIVLAGNLLLMVVFWEATSLASFLLVAWWHGRADARNGATMALTVTGAGGLALLAGVLLVGHIVGSLELDAVLAAGATLRAHPLYEVALALVLLGAFTKSAQFPFHFWLPHAMAAPTPVSAYLHSATMVKAGVFLLARLHPALAGTEAWFWSVTTIGATTLLVGAAFAIFQHDLKGLLAYSTISHLGLIVLLLGLAEPLAVVAAVFHVVNHAVFKAGLFMAAGIIDHECGTRDLRRINGLARRMPVTAALAIVSAAAMAGVPLLNGFLSKEMFFAETLAADAHAALRWLLPAVALASGVLGVAYSARFVHDVFFNGEPVDLPRAPHEPPLPMRLPLLLLVGACVAVGLAPAEVAGPALALAAQAAVHGAPGAGLPPYTLALWHGLNLPLLMSAAAVAGGALLYLALHRGVDLHRLAHPPLWWRSGGREAFAAAVAVALVAARSVQAALARGRLRRDLLLLVLLACLAAAWPLRGAGPTLALDLDGLDLPTLALAAVGIVAAIATTLAHRRRALALVLMGATGLVVSLAFAWLSAPDLALTQALVEVATMAVMVLALRALPDPGRPETARLRQGFDAAIAIAAGLGVAAFAAWVLALPPQGIGGHFLERSWSEGGGGNAVNVIIVDFRGFDTLGEITVLAIAALAISGVLANFAPRVAPPGPPSAMLTVVAQAVLPLALLVSLHLFLRGHNQPGGGFVAGLVLAIALALRRWSDLLPLRSRALSTMAWGLLVAAGTGMAAWAFGLPFLTHNFGRIELPLVGAVGLTSAMAFDLGVALVVAGGTLTMLAPMLRIARSGARA